ncbi:MAG: RNA-binding S4 domain-containing protein [Planctomycetes bacterium]|nr:RNA-binding S4 domain-containing protein [Planctomycetota bacterium]
MKHVQFRLRDEVIELHSLLKAQGVCPSGGAAKVLVASGAVRVDGAVELRKACKIRAGQRVQTGEVEIELLPPAPKPS